VLPHPGRQKVYALGTESGTLFEVDVASLALSRRARAGGQAVSMRLAPSGDAIWVLYRDPNGLVEFGLDTLSPRKRIGLNAAPDHFDVSSEGLAVIASSAGRAVMVASLDHAAVERTIPLANPPRMVLFQQKGKQIIAASNAERSLTMIDVPSGNVLVRLPVPMQPRNFCNVDEGTLFVTGDGIDAVVVVYPYQTEIGETTLAGRSPAGMAVVGNKLLVANPPTNTVTVLDTDTRRLLAVVEVGQEPREILITPDNQFALVLNQKSGDVAVIRIAWLDGRERVHRYKSGSLFTLIPVGQKPVSAAVVRLS